jgi:hypothetical protein
LKELVSQFTPAELVFFEKTWVEYYRQFAEDVTPTEENEMIELIRVRILINRVMRDKHEIIQNIQRIERLLEIETSKEDINMVVVTNLQQQLGGAIASKAAFIKEYDTLTGKLERFTKDLKGTRESRLKRIEDSKSNFTSWLRNIEEEEVRRREGYDMEKHAIAGDKALERLSEWHEYDDKQVDQPFLNEETVKDD